MKKKTSENLIRESLMVDLQQQKNWVFWLWEYKIRAGILVSKIQDNVVKEVENGKGYYLDLYDS